MSQRVRFRRSVRFRSRRAARAPPARRVAADGDDPGTDRVDQEHGVARARKRDCLCSRARFFLRPRRVFGFVSLADAALGRREERAGHPPAHLRHRLRREVLGVRAKVPVGFLPHDGPYARPLLPLLPRARREARDLRTLGSQRVPLYERRRRGGPIRRARRRDADGAQHNLERLGRCVSGGDATHALDVRHIRQGERRGDVLQLRTG